MLQAGSRPLYQYYKIYLSDMGFTVTCIIHSKHPEYPKHEFLIIETKDMTNENIRLLVLERNISDVKSPTVEEDSDVIEKFNHLLRTVVGLSLWHRLRRGLGVD